MTNDTRVLARKRFEQGKDAHSHVPKNRHARRAAERHAKLLEATRMRSVGQKNAPHVADSAKERHEDTLRAELAAQQNACPVRHNALIATLEIALALSLASCGSAMTDDQDAAQDADAVTDVVEEDNSPDSEVDAAVEDISPAEDVETPDEGTTEDIAPEDRGVEDVSVEDVSPEMEADAPDEDVTEAEEGTEEADATDTEEADSPDVADAEEDSIEFVDGDAEATDTYDCTETITIVPGTPVSGPELLCGSTQTATPTFEETSWVGADCEGTSTTRRMIGKAVVLTPPLDTAGLACARGTTTNALNGVEMFVDLTPTNLDTATTLVCQRNMLMGWTLDGGVAEYDASINDVIGPTEILLAVRPPSGTPRDFRAYDTGVVTSSWLRDRGYVAFEINEATRRASLCYVYAPIFTRTAGFGEVWTVDGRTFTFNSVFSGDGTQLLGWEWVSP